MTLYSSEAEGQTDGVTRPRRWAVRPFPFYTLHTGHRSPGLRGEVRLTVIRDSDGKNLFVHVFMTAGEAGPVSPIAQMRRPEGREGAPSVACVRGRVGTPLCTQSPESPVTTTLYCLQSRRLRVSFSGLV